MSNEEPPRRIAISRGYCVRIMRLVNRREEIETKTDSADFRGTSDVNEGLVNDF